MQRSNSEQDRPVISASDARAGRIINGGAMARVLVISTALAVAALFVTYLILA